MIDTNDPNEFFFNDEEKPKEEIKDAVKEEKETFFEEEDQTKEEVFEEGPSLMEQADDMANDILDKAFGLFSKVKKTATETAKQVFEETRDKAYDLEEKMRLKEEAAQKEWDNKEKHKVEDSLLTGFDSFFDKAKKFAGDMEERGKNIVDDATNKLKLTKDELKEAARKNTLSGFDDLDGDGDPLIDDAIIEED